MKSYCVQNVFQKLFIPPNSTALNLMQTQLSEGLTRNLGDAMAQKFISTVSLLLLVITMFLQVNKHIKLATNFFQLIMTMGNEFLLIVLK